jgi:hypothetical protein
MKEKRTTGMTIVATLDVLFGLLGLLMGALGVASALASARQAIVVEGTMGIAGATAGQQATAEHLLALSLFALVIALVSIVAGVALFFMWRWARTLNLAYALLAVARGLVLFLFPALIMLPNTTPMGIGQRAIGLLMAIIYPVIILLLFARPDWKARFTRASRETA